MHFNLKRRGEVLERTPQTLEYFLSESGNEVEETYNVREVIEHLIEGEKNNWIPRLEFILKVDESKRFPSFECFSHSD